MLLDEEEGGGGGEGNLRGRRLLCSSTFLDLCRIRKS